MTRTQTAVPPLDAKTHAPSALRPASWVDRQARALVVRGLGSLQHGALHLRDAMGDILVGDTDSDASLHAMINVHDPAFYRRVLWGGSLGAGEAYLDGQWTSPDLPAALRLFVRNTEATDDLERGVARLAYLLKRLAHTLRSNSKRGSERNIHEHYDLGNDFFAMFLDETMTYSSGIFTSPDATMHDASIEKLDRLCRVLALKPEMDVVEIGTGWGSFSIHAARNYGCRITTTTISQDQFDLASTRIQNAGLADRVTILKRDYRDLEGQFDRLVSIEMIEAVGQAFLPTYFQTCSRLLRPGGVAGIQAILMPDERYEQYCRTVDFIQRYVFPGGHVPSLGALRGALAAGTDLEIDDVHAFSQDYARTLRIWRARFGESEAGMRQMGFDDRFIRLWDYYLAYCEAGFAERYIDVAQIVLTKSRTKPLRT